MSDIDGRWNCIVDAPMGEQKFLLTVTSADGRFTGRAEGSVGAIEIDDGEIDGDTLAWSMGIAKPLPLRLNCRATATGDMLEGSVSAGIFGSFPIRGTRA